MGEPYGSFCVRSLVQIVMDGDAPTGVALPTRELQSDGAKIYVKHCEDSNVNARPYGRSDVRKDISI